MHECPRCGYHPNQEEEDMKRIDRHVEGMAKLLALLKSLGTRGEKNMQKLWGTE